MSKVRTLDTPAGLAVLKRTNRKTLAISVLPDGVLELTAPLDSDETLIVSKVGKRMKWIERQRTGFSAMNATRVSRRYVSGATHRYLGKQYRLKIRRGGGESVRLVGGYFHVISATGSANDIKTQLDGWLRDKARTQFQKRLDAWEPWCKRHGLPEPKLVVRRMPKRWGSAGSNGKISLTPELVQAPSACIDYVVVHEICHLKHPCHSKAFFQLLSSLLPGWRDLKLRLESAELS